MSSVTRHLGTLCFGLETNTCTTPFPQKLIHVPRSETQTTNTCRSSYRVTGFKPKNKWYRTPSDNFYLHVIFTRKTSLSKLSIYIIFIIIICDNYFNPYFLSLRCLSTYSNIEYKEFLSYSPLSCIHGVVHLVSTCSKRNDTTPYVYDHCTLQIIWVSIWSVPVT